jgi:hypothetical protein
MTYYTRTLPHILCLLGLCFTIQPLEAKRNHHDHDREAIGSTIPVSNQIIYFSGNTNIDLNEVQAQIQLAELQITSNHPSGFDLKFIFENLGKLAHTNNQNIPKIPLRGMKVTIIRGKLGKGLKFKKKETLNDPDEWGFLYGTTGKAKRATDIILSLTGTVPNSQSHHRLAGIYREYVTVHILSPDDDD